MPIIINMYRTRYKNGSTRGFHSKPMMGRLSRVTNTPIARTMPNTPSQIPTSCLRARLAANPTTANDITKMFQAVGSGKYICQNESLTPLGRGSYFMSVMKPWLVKNGTTQNDDSKAANPITDSPHLTRRLSAQMASINNTPPKTNSNTMPWLRAASATRAAVVTRRSPVYRP